MNRERVLAELSTTHAVALRLRDDGAPDERIAAALGIPVEAVTTLLEVAQAKFDALWAEQSRVS